MVTFGFGLLFGFAMGSLTDRLKPVRLMGPLFIVQAFFFFGSYYFVRDNKTYLIAMSAISIVQFFQGVVIGAFTIEVFPREKLGQFCSAQAVFHQFSGFLIGPFIGMFYDHIHNNRFGFIWQGVFYIFSAMAYIKVYFNWKERHGRSLLPKAG